MDSRLRFFFTTVTVFAVTTEGIEPSVSCRERSKHLRHDGGLCFEIQPWEHEAAELDVHVAKLRDTFNASDARKKITANHMLVHSDVARYMDTVLVPFLDTYHQNILHSYEKISNKILTRITDEVAAAVRHKNSINKDLINLADELNVPDMCNEERRAVRTLASKHVAQVHLCTELARKMITKMSTYADELISITKKHMQVALAQSASASTSNQTVARNSDDGPNFKDNLRYLSGAAFNLGYELDLSIINSRRHNEHTCERLTSCVAKVKRNTEDSVATLRDELYQCVYA